MAVDILLPQLGLTMTEGLITEWKKKEGDPVRKGEVIFLVENDKATVEVEAQADGILARILVEPMKTVPVSTVVGVIAAEGEKAEASSKTAAKAPEARAGAAPAPKEPVPSSSAASAAKETAKDGFVAASPLARKAARDAGLDLAGIRGSGPGGAVVERDLPPEVRAAAEAASTAPASRRPAAGRAAAAQPAVPEYEDVALTRIGAVSAERLALSWTTIPQFTLYAEARASALIALRDHYKKKNSPVSVTVILAKLLAHSLLKFPKLNAEWLGGGKVRTYSKVNVAIAMDTADGLVVPVLGDCASKGYRRLSEEMKTLAEKGKGKTLSPGDFAGGTVTLSNLGMFGVTRFRAIVNPPQTAIVSVGAVTRKPVETEEGVAFADFIEIGLTADHRAADGAYAARFMADFKASIENPALVGD